MDGQRLTREGAENEGVVETAEGGSFEIEFGQRFEVAVTVCKVTFVQKMVSGGWG